MICILFLLLTVPLSFVSLFNSFEGSSQVNLFVGIQHSGHLRREKGAHGICRFSKRQFARRQCVPTFASSLEYQDILHHIPWTSVAELFLIILTIFGALVLVVCIDGKQQWPTSVHVTFIRGRELRISLITPATTLPIAHSIIASLVGLAVKDGITMVQ